MSTIATSLTDRIVSAFNRGDVDAFANCFTEDAVQYHPFFPAPLRGRPAIREAEAAMFAAFDDISFTVSNVIEEGDRVALECRVKATNTKPLVLPDGRTIPATGRTVDLTMASFFKVDADGQIREAHRYQDNLAMMQALGLIPDGS